jgi:predicted porin
LEIQMKTKLSLAVAAALVAAASSANAGIMIPAGDWTLDIGGVVNAYYTSTTGSGVSNTNNITTGLLPNYLSVSGKTRQNDLDVGFTISIQPGAATSTSATLGSLNQRQAFLTFGDASWGSIKLGKDLGIYASDAILSDMTLLGVGQGAAAVGNTTLGRIGAGYMYADWKSQIAYSSPNWNGFSFTAGVTQAWDAQATAGVGSATSNLRGGNQPAFEGKASYAWAGDFAGKVWVSGLSQEIKGILAANTSERVNAVDIGANVNVAGFGLTGYYSKGEGTGKTFLLLDGLDAAGNKRDSDDWFVQGTYTLPTVGTKLGVSYGESTLDGNSGEAATLKELSTKMWTIGAYHPLTKHLNLVAEYSNAKNEQTFTGGSTKTEPKTISLGAILFF